MTQVRSQEAADTVRALCGKNGVGIISLDAREYPEEVIFVVRVSSGDYEKALSTADLIDTEFKRIDFPGFVTFRKASADASNPASSAKLDLSSDKALELANLLTARSRASEVQPSLTYIRDAANHLSLITTSRNHLVFGRRGAGKTTLLVEAKRIVEQEGHPTLWLNLQTHRHSSPAAIFLWVVRLLCERMQTHFGSRQPRFLADVEAIQDDVAKLDKVKTPDARDVRRLIPKVQATVRRFLASTDVRLFIFLDDLHYLPKALQPAFLDIVHALTRDIDAWIKVACIRHLSRWFEHSPPTGLQTGHDAEHIDLDLTLESPSEAKEFLDKVIDSYAKHIGLPSARVLFSEDALNRLVLASGAVPRDYLVLSAGAIRQARRRQKSRRTGVEDVNRAAGEQSKVKISELEDDAASSTNEGPREIINALNLVRDFCLVEKKYTYFRVDFRDKESRQKEYTLIQSLLDVRILHLVASSLSDKRHAGRRSEVYMLDLSQFSGQRLKKHISVLDFVTGHIVLKQTTSNAPDRVGDTAMKLLQILRRGPLLDLVQLKAAASKALNPTGANAPAG
jgi:hypothetical protein